MIAWTWAVGRLIDLLEKVPAAKINTTRLAGIAGCSRYGKGSMAVSAFEPVSDLHSLRRRRGCSVLVYL
jgi:hypothetical protein